MADPKAKAAKQPAYELRISRLTVDKLGVKLYDKASAVVAELVANAYDADAESVHVTIPLATELASRGADKVVADKGYAISVADDGHGMTPDEAREYFLDVGRDRRTHPEQGGLSRTKQRRVMGRKGIGKLAPFGICRRIEVLSSGGKQEKNGYLTTHFYMDFDKIVTDEDAPVPLDAGPLDGSFRAETGTTITLSDFLPKRVPDERTFHRQVARRFRLADPKFVIVIRDSRQNGSGKDVVVQPFEVPAVPATRIDLSDRPVDGPDGPLPVTGWLGMATEPYRDEEMAGVRIYARNKIVATTRDFELPAGYTGEFTMRSYLVGEVHAEWLDADDDEDLIRTDRQSILWDSDLGQALQRWGAGIIKEIGERSRGPRRERVRDQFLRLSDIATRAEGQYHDEAVVEAAVDLAEKIGAFADEGELADADYVRGLTDVILSVAPHRALVEAFKAISKQEDKTVDDLLGLFGKARVAEMASYSQIAAERVLSVKELEQVIGKPDVAEADLQGLIARAPWLIRPDWSVITENQTLKTFRRQFAQFWKQRHGVDIDIAISHESKRPDFTLVHIGRMLHVAELKVPGHAFGNADYERLENYLAAFEEFFERHKEFADSFPDGWQVDLVCDSVDIKDRTSQRAFSAEVERQRVVRSTWVDFLANAVKAHEQFLDVHDQAHGTT